MLGGEGEGLRRNLQKKADFVIGVEGQRLGQGGVDSLNVSVAAGVLCDAFLKGPAKRRSQGSHTLQGPYFPAASSEATVMVSEEENPKVTDNQGVNRDDNILF